MFNIKLIKYFYIFLTALVFLTPKNISILELIPSLILLWISFFFFSYSQRKKKEKQSQFLLDSQISNSTSPKLIIFLALYALIFIPLYVKFYTGSSVIESLLRFFSGKFVGMESNYSSYQQYFEDSNISAFSFSKLPYIIGYGILKFLFWSIVIRIIGYSRRVTFIEVGGIFVMFFMFFLIGVSRGTSFENFELLILLVFSFLVRFQVLYGKSWLYGKAKVFTYSLLSLGIIYFIFSKSLRYGGEIIYTNPTNTLRHNPDSIISEYFPFIAIITNNLSGYFLFGSYFISVSINHIWLSGTLKGILAAIIPFGTQICGYGSDYREILCNNNVIDCGASWIPDCMRFIATFGLIIYFVFLYILGKFSSLCYGRAISGSIKHAICLFLIIVLMFSLPVGNFITASSSTIIAIFILFLSFLFPSKFRILNLKIIKL